MPNHIPSIGRRLALAVAISATCGSAHAAGFALIEQSASGMGNAFAGAAAIADDASTVWFNPAGMTRLGKDQVVVAAHYIAPEAEFTNDGSQLGTGAPLVGTDGSTSGKTDEVGIVGNFYYVRDLGDDAKFGLGINTPFGLSSKYDSNWIGRYHAINSEIMTLNINPSLASKVTDKLSLGVGFNVQYIQAELSSTVFDGTQEGVATIEGDGISFGANFGLLYEYSERSRIGIAYRSKVAHNLDGDAKFDGVNQIPSPLGGNLYVDTDASAGVDLPQMASLSYVRDMNDRLTLLADVTWTGWSSFDELRVSYDNAGQPDSVTTEDWEDTWRYSVGMNYRYSDALTLRAGVAYDEEPIPSAERRTARIPGNDRTWLALGFGYAPSADLQFDFGYAHLFVKDADIDNTLETLNPAANHTLSGSYEAEVDIFSAQVTWKF
ncbi:MAG: OmpP1/FadL family transporter [Gammaproteobacteria bacterium]|nr:OmpP1/FadL family transporter [Gammaproteobacteria bacterium]MDX5375039.1 OmpP1/FadL family transporter [Gammaproteobacteria bacterium]